MKQTLFSLAVIFIVSFLHADNRPNIVWIFSDDHSIQTIGAYGGRLEKLDPTPNLDRLASEGMVFDRSYVGNSICAPARATLLTGKHSHLNGKLTNRGEFNHDQQQFQKILQGNGYQTVMVGKIHLSGKMQGFDYWEVLPGQGAYNNPTFVTEEGNTQYDGYTTDIITDKALDWMKDKRDPNKPFMIMIHHKAPHRNWTPAERHADYLEDVNIPEPANLFDSYDNRGAAAKGQDMSISKTMTERDLKLAESNRNERRWQEYNNQKLEGKELVRWKYQQYLKDYLRCIKAVDENIGRVLDYLDEAGLSENTVVFYGSDQGFYMGEHGWFDKRFMYEESFRTPLIARWPGVIEPGRRNDDLVQNIDYAETFLDIAGVKAPADMQGESLVPLMKGKTPKDWRDSLYYTYFEYPGAHSVRKHEGVFMDNGYKLIRFYGQDVPDGEEWEFYDLKRDPKEMNNAFSNPEYSGKIAELKKELVRLQDYYDVPEGGVEGIAEPKQVKKPKKKKKSKEI